MQQKQSEGAGAEMLRNSKGMLVGEKRGVMLINLDEGPNLEKFHSNWR